MRNNDEYIARNGDSLLDGTGTFHLGHDVPGRNCTSEEEQDDSATTQCRRMREENGRPP